MIEVYDLGEGDTNVIEPEGRDAQIGLCGRI